MANNDYAEYMNVGSPFLGFFSQGSEKPVKNAFYNAAAFVFVLLGGAAAVLVYYILEPFIKPLLWAVLVGSVIYPFKYSLVLRYRTWLEEVKAKRGLLTVNSALLPFKMLEGMAEIAGIKILRNLMLSAAIFIGMPVLYALYRYFSTLLWLLPFEILLWMIHMLFLFASLLASLWVALPSLVWCVLAVGGFSQSHVAQYPRIQSLICNLACFSVICKCLDLVGVLPYGVLFLVSLLVYGVVISDRKESTPSGKVNTKKADDTEIGTVVERHEEEEVSVAMGSPASADEATPSDLSLVKRKKTLSLSNVVHAKEPPSACSNATKLVTPPPSSASAKQYLTWLLYACLLVQLWHHMWLLRLLPLPLAYVFIKAASSYLGLYSLLYQKWLGLLDLGKELNMRHSFQPPTALRIIGKALLRLDSWVLNRVLDGLDGIVTALLISVLLIGAVMTVVFLAVQLYSEGVHVLQVCHQLANATLTLHPEAQHLLPNVLGVDMDVDAMMGTVLDNAYAYGKKGIAQLVESVTAGMDPARARHLEQSLLQVWDRVYQAWIVPTMPDGHEGPKVPPQAVAQSIDDFLSGLKKTPELLNFSALAHFAKENVGTLLGVLESLFSLLRSNMALLLSFLTTLLSLLLGGGTAILNFIISRVIFLTALFYVLAASENQYKPVQLLAALTPGHGTKLGRAIEEAVNTVLIASAKMGAFYAMWTWLMHTLFESHLVIIPSVMAAVLSVVPVLGPYWAAIPAALELWAVQGRGAQAIALLACQALPLTFVDAAIYSEIKGGGHTYLTALSVAGGIYWLGVEGAIVGPLLLCVLLVGMSMTSLMTQADTPGTPAVSFLTRFAPRRLTRTDTMY